MIPIGAPAQIKGRHNSLGMHKSKRKKKDRTARRADQVIYSPKDYSKQPRIMLTGHETKGVRPKTGPDTPRRGRGEPTLETRVSVRRADFTNQSILFVCVS